VWFPRHQGNTFSLKQRSLPTSSRLIQDTSNYFIFIQLSGAFRPYSFFTTGYPTFFQPFGALPRLPEQESELSGSLHYAWHEFMA
jgi:hypothetical protein